MENNGKTIKDNKDCLESYSSKISVQFNRLPPIKLVSVIMEDGASVIDRLAETTRKRFFTLEEDWHLTISRLTGDKARLNGTIVVPELHNDEKIVFDGASVPFPWLVSFLSIGILRPLGVMLTASLVHDFAFKYGYLLILQGDSETPKKVSIERHEADALFRDIITCVSNIRSIGWIAWLAVRIGWLGVKYNGRRFGGQPPYGILTILGVILYFLFGFLISAGENWTDIVGQIVNVFVGFYAVLYLLTVTTLIRRGPMAPIGKNKK